MSEYIYENVPHPKCDVAGCMEPGWFAWDGVLRCRRHHAELETTISREKATQTRLERLEDKLYAQMVLDAHKPFGKRGVTDEDLQIYAALAKRYAAHLVRHKP